MNIISIENISKSYGDRTLFDKISLGISQGEKIGLIGINGTGKSTLLKIVAGVESPDEGAITTGSDATIEYLPQNPSFENDSTVMQQVFKGSSPEMKLLREYEQALQEFKHHADDPQCEKRLLALTHQMDAIQAWNMESEAKIVLSKLGINDISAKVGELSGGERKRIALAGALINRTDLLILDEPTNQLDSETVDWLEKYLNSRKGALLMVTHDRYFLERVCKRIVELDQGQLYSYQASYNQYLEMKAEREESLQASERKRQSLFRKELEWIRRGAKARSTKQKARIERFEALKETKLPDAYDGIEIKAGTSRLGKKTIELDHVGIDLADRPIIRDFSYILLRDDRIGVLGPNGSGKSTLLKMIAGILSPDRGSVIIGDTVKIGYFAQENDAMIMDDSIRVIDYVKNEAEYLATSDGLISASQMLDRYLFPPSVQWKPVHKLSGGEKRRLYLLKVLMGAPNVLLLDEPTNDLDIQTLTILEDYLEDFSGAVIAVSHDRYFLDRVVNKLFVFEGDASIRQFQGDYSDYRETQEEALALKDNRAKERTGQQEPTGTKEKPLKFTFKEQREFEQIDQVITDLEARIEDINGEMERVSSDYLRLQELLASKESLKQQLDQVLERWVYLNELADQITKSKEK